MIPVLETARLRLRPPHSDDLDAIYRLGANPKVMRYITQGATLSRMETMADLEKRIAASQFDLGYWITELRHTGKIIGWSALKPLDNTPEIEIGYRLLEEYWNRGYATEASRCLLYYGFQQLQLPRIVAIALEENRASTRVMEKIGLRYETRGTFYGVECVVYALNRKSYLSNVNPSPSNHPGRTE